MRLILNQYFKSNLMKIIKVKGYNKQLNPSKDYKIAKEPTGKLDKIEIHSPEEAYKWINAGGWLGLRLKGFTFLDVDRDNYKIDIVKWYIEKKKLKPAIQKTKNGYHFLFKGENFNNSDYLSKLGVNLTIKSGKNSYIIVEPSEYKKWKYLPQNFNELSQLPDLFTTLDIKNKKQLLNAIVINIAYCHQEELINGYEDIELSFIYFLIEHAKKDDKYIHNAFKIIFPDYDYSRTDNLIKRTREKLINGEEVKGIRSLIDKINNAGLDNLKSLFDKYYNLNKNTSKNNNKDIAKLETEVIETIEDIETLESLPEFPIDVFPKEFQDLVVNIANAYNIPADIPAVTLLFLTGGCIGATRRIEITKNFRIYPNLYCAVVAESGMRKSPPIKYMLKHIRQRDKDLADQYIEKLKNYNAELEIYKIRKANIEKEAKGKKITPDLSEIPLPPDKPPEKKIIVDDITIEKLAESLAFNQRGLMSYHDELRSLLSGFGKYSKVEAAENEKSFFDKCFDGEYYKYERKSSESLILTRPLLSLYGAIQPDAFKYSFKDKDLMSGFFQRWIFYHLPKETMQKFIGITKTEVSYNNKELLDNFIDYLLNFNFNEESLPVDVEVNNESYIVFESYYKNIQKKMVYDVIGNGFTGFLSKARNLPAKFALHLLAMDCFLKRINLDENIYIQPQLMEYACKISDWFIEHTRFMWQYYLDDLSINIQPVDEIVVEALISLFEQGKAVDNVILTEDIKNWIDDNKGLKLTTRKVGRLLKKLNLEPQRKDNKRGALVSHSIIKILKNKILKNMAKTAEMAENSITTYNNKENHLPNNCQILNSMPNMAETKNDNLPNNNNQKIFGRKMADEKENDINKLNDNLPLMPNMPNNSKNKNAEFNNNDFEDEDNIFLYDFYLTEKLNNQSQKAEKDNDEIDIYNDVKPQDELEGWTPPRKVVNLGEDE